MDNNNIEPQQIHNANLSDLSVEDEERLLNSPPSLTEVMEVVVGGMPAAPEVPSDSIEQRDASSASVKSQQGASLAPPPWRLGYRKLTGAGKKRFSWLIRHGRTREEAVIEASKPMVKEGSHQVPSGWRRGAPAGTTTRSQKGPETRKRVSFVGKPQKGAGSYKDAVVGRKVGILDVNFPEKLLIFGQMLKVQDSILQAIVEQEGKGPKPVFLDSSYRRGWLSLTCGDDATLQWLKNHVATTKPCEETNLRLVEGADLPHPQIAIGYFPNSADDAEDRIFGLLRGQNDGLHIEHWRTVQRRNDGTMAILTLSVDTASAAVLQSNSRVNYKFGQATIRLKDKRRKAGATSDVEGETEMEVGGPQLGAPSDTLGAGTSGVVPELRHTAPLRSASTPDTPSTSRRPSGTYPLPAGHPSGSSRDGAPPATPAQQRLDSARGGKREGQDRPVKRPQLHGSSKRKPSRPPEEWQRRKKGGKKRR